MARRQEQAVPAASRDPDPVRRRWLWLLVPLLATFLAAEILRDSHPGEATALSMLAWLVFLACGLAWAFERSGWRAGLRTLARLAILTAASSAVLWAYYLRSHLLDAGVHVDSVYTYVGLERFLRFEGPITFAGRTPSYPQFPLMLLSHLPAAAVGFDRLGPFAPHLGMLLQVGFLLALATRFLGRARLATEAALAALAAAVFSNRMLVLSYGVVGYAIPAICLGLMLLVVADDEAVPDPNRLVGGLLVLGLLHYYSALVVLLPLVATWLALRRRPLPAVRRFLRDNPLLGAVAVLLLVTLAVHPDLLMRRLGDVTAGGGRVMSRMEMLQRNLVQVRSFPKVWFRLFCVSNPGSWHLLNLPPLGGLVLPLTAGAYVLSCVALRGRRRRYALYCLAFLTGCLLLSVAQRILAGFQDYRDFTFVFAILVGGLSFLFRIPRLAGVLRVVAVVYAVAFGAYNWVDLGNLHGKVHRSADFAYRSQAVLEEVRALLRAGSLESLGAVRVYVVIEKVVPIELLYLPHFGSRARVLVVRAEKFCADPDAAFAEAAREGCGGFVFAGNGAYCPNARSSRNFPRERPWALLFGSVCGRPGERPVRALDGVPGSPAG
jgi:hypothetical protein